MSKTIVVLHGDQTGEELLAQVLRVLDPEVIGLRVSFQHFDLSLGNRRATHNQVIEEAAAAMAAAGYGLKAATITPATAGDIGSPNMIVRERINGSIIVRTGRHIPGVTPLGDVHGPIAVIRMAVGDAYGAKEWREGEGLQEAAYRTERITRWDCRAVAEYAFHHAERLGGKVFGGPKFTVSPIYEGLLKEEMDAAAQRHPHIRYDPQLIDTTYALLLTHSREALVIPALNRDGDCLSDLVLQLFGSIAGSESLLLSLDDDWRARVVMAEAPHGTAPLLFGKNLANPMAMILAGASVLSYMGEPEAVVACAIEQSVFDVVADGIRTADLQGRATTAEFTDEVIRRVRSKLR